MSTSTRSEHSSLINDLVTWVGSVTNDPKIRVEEYVDGDRHVIRADLPGVEPHHDIDLHVEGGVLRLRGQRREEQREKTRTEIRYGSFERVLTLPPGTTAEQVSATYLNGVLTVTFPAAAPQPSTRVPVTSSERPAE